MTIVPVGTGDVQISVIWNQPVDLDLALLEPDSTIIFWNAAESESGGMLDLDSNPACRIDGVNNENITYDGFNPPSGEYSVLVNLFDDCGVTEPINFTVTVRVNGGVQTFTGILSGDDESRQFLVSTFVVR